MLGIVQLAVANLLRELHSCFIDFAHSAAGFVCTSAVFVYCGYIDRLILLALIT